MVAFRLVGMLVVALPPRFTALPVTLSDPPPDIEDILHLTSAK